MDSHVTENGPRFCCDCQHSIYSEPRPRFAIAGVWRCQRYTTDPDPVTGRVTLHTCSVLRRKKSRACGEEGRGWEPKIPSPRIQPLSSPIGAVGRCIRNLIATCSPVR